MPPALPVVRIDADSRNVGKTRLASALIEEFTRRGFAVGAVKHSHHPVPSDRPGSDTDQFARSGAVRVLFAAADGALERAAPESDLAKVLARFSGQADIVVVEGFKGATPGARIHIDPSGRAVLTLMDGRVLLEATPDDPIAFADVLTAEFELASGGSDELARLVRVAAAAHGHRCPGVTLGVRMALAALAALDLRRAPIRGRLAVTVESARCATDAIAAVTGCSLGRRTLHVEERGQMAARFVDLETGRTVRVAAREESRALAAEFAPPGVSRRHAQSIAYRLLADADLLECVPSSADGASQIEYRAALPVA